MSDHLHGSEQYYLDSIDQNIGSVREAIERIDNRDNTVKNLSLNSIGEIAGGVERLLHAFQSLLNIENEGITILRDTIKLRDEDRRLHNEECLTSLLYDLLKFSKMPDFVCEYIQRMDVSGLKITGTTLEFFLRTITEETENRINAMKKTAALLAEDEERR